MKIQEQQLVQELNGYLQVAELNMSELLLFLTTCTGDIFASPSIAAINGVNYDT